MSYKFVLIGSLVLLAIGLSIAVVDAQRPPPGGRRAPAWLAGTGFTYQGQLKNNGALVNNTCDFAFSLWDAESNGNQVGTNITQTIPVTSGLFTTQIDFGGNAFTGDARWLASSVRCPSGGGGYTGLSPRQPLTPAPYALALPGLYTQQNATSPNVIGGHISNTVSVGVVGATIGGGGLSILKNSVSADLGTIGGGDNNTIGGSASTIDGGENNTANGHHAAIGGGSLNIASGNFATIGGGVSNSAAMSNTTVSGGFNNTASGQYATIGGGTGNQASGPGSFIGGGGSDGFLTKMNVASGQASTIGGGISNTITSFGHAATIGGGNGNTASNDFATIGGGANNNASQQDATVGGGFDNTASGGAATVPGGGHNIASGSFSLAAGSFANTNNQTGTFVWGDTSTPNYISATAPYQFLVRATGGITLYTNSGATIGATLQPGSGTWSSVSDRNLKDNFVVVNGQDVLVRLAAVPIQTWNYKSQDPAIRHIGPMAQDFYAAFNVGEDDKHISTVDADGVALASIQGLYQIVQEKDARIAELERRVAALERGEPVRAGAVNTSLDSNAFGFGALLLSALALYRAQRKGAK